MDEPDSQLTALGKAQRELADLCHDFKNQLGGVRLYAAWLKRTLERNSLEAAEGIDVCEKMIGAIDSMALRARQAEGRSSTGPAK